MSNRWVSHYDVQTKGRLCKTQKAETTVGPLSSHVPTQQHLHRPIDPQPIAQISLPQRLLRLISSKAHLHNTINSLSSRVLMRRTIEDIYLRRMLLESWVVGAAWATTAIAASAVAGAARADVDVGLLPDMRALRAEGGMVWERQLSGRLGEEDGVLDDGGHGAGDTPPVERAGPCGSGWCG
jgi:hypothetical protein